MMIDDENEKDDAELADDALDGLSDEAPEDDEDDPLMAEAYEEEEGKEWA